MNALERLQKNIAEYESDTFSAEGSNITADEALKVANELVTMWAERNLDGDLITEMLNDIREEA